MIVEEADPQMEAETTKILTVPRPEGTLESSSQMFYFPLRITQPTDLNDRLKLKQKEKESLDYIPHKSV